MKGRRIHVFADGAVAGSTIAFAINLSDWMTRNGPSMTLPENARLALLGTVPALLFHTGQFASSRWGLAFVTIAVAFSVWRRTRRAASRIAGISIAALGAYVSALAGVLCYSLNPSLGLLSTLLAPLPAAILARRSGWTTNAMVVFTGSLALGVLASQAVFPFQAGVGQVISPLPPFLFFAVLSVVAAQLARRFKETEQTDFFLRFVRMFGLSSVCLCASFLVAYESYQLRSRTPSSETVRVLEGPAYDVRLIGERPDLVWTNRQHTQVLQDAYGESPQRYALEQEERSPGEEHKAERIWPSADGGFYVQFEPLIGWWKAAQPGESIPVQTTEWFQFPDTGLPETFEHGKSLPETATFAEDPSTQRSVFVTEFNSNYAVVDRGSHAIKAMGKLSDAFWPWWYATVDASTHVAFISTAIEGGWLYELDLSSLRVIRKVPGVFFYETVIDRKEGLLWGARPLAGDLLGIDARTLEFRYRIPVEPAVRDLPSRRKYR